MGGSRQRTRVWRVGFWSLAVVVTVLSLTPPTHLPPQMFDLWDKAQHALAFAALASLGRLAYPRLGWSVVAAALLLHGAAIEAAQAATGWRHAEVADWLADAVGVGLVWSVAAVRRRRLSGLTRASTG